MKNTILDRAPRIRRGVLLGLVIGVPLVFAPGLHDSFNVAKLGLLAVGVGGVAILRGVEILSGANHRGLFRLAVPAAAVALPFFVAWVVSPYRGWSLLGSYPRFSGLLPYVLAIALGVLVADAFAGRARTIAQAYVAAGAGVGAYAFVQSVGLDPLRWALKGADVEGVAASTLGNTNFTGGFLATVLPVALGLYLMRATRTWFVATAAGLTLAGWVVSGSQGAWLAGIAAVAVVLGTALMPRWKMTRPGGLILAAMIAAATIGAVLIGIVASERLPIPHTVERRGDWWIGATRMMADHPIVGQGPNAFAIDGTLYRTEADGRAVGFDFDDDPHSVPLAFGTSAGILGFVGLLLAFAWLIRWGLILPHEHITGISFFGALVAYVVQSLVTVDAVPLRAGLWVVAGAMIASSLPLDEDRRKRGRKQRQAPVPAMSWTWKPLGVSMAVAGCAAILWGAGFVLSDARFAHANQLFREGHGDEARAQYERAIGFRDEPYYRRVYGNRMAAVALAIADANGPTAAAPFASISREAFAFVDDLPHANSIVDLARFLVAWSVHDPSARNDALSLYERALRRDPNNPALQSEVAEVRQELQP